MPIKNTAGRRFTAAILISSDRASRGERSDDAGPKLENRLRELDYEVISTVIVPDNRQKIASILRKWVKSKGIDLILVSGGTGLSPRDVTPEATLDIIERRIPGMEEAMRQASLKITPFAMLSRGVAGTAENTLIINLPGNPDGALENLHVVEPALAHALKLIKGEKADD